MSENGTAAVATAKTTKAMVASPEGLDATTWASLAPAERECVSAKIRKLLDEGKARDQAIAIAISTCAPAKARTAERAAVAIPAVPRGGAYEAEQAADGTWTVRDVPVFMAHRHERTGETFGRAWLERAVERAQARYRQDQYLAPLHVRHHSAVDRGVERAGFVLPTRVEKRRYEGVWRDVVLADLLGVPGATFERLKRRELPYVSVEILDTKKPEINSLALLDHEVPYFRLPLLTIGRERKLGVPVTLAAAGSRSPARYYRAAPPGAALLFRFPQEESMTTTTNFADEKPGAGAPPVEGPAVEAPEAGDMDMDDDMGAKMDECLATCKACLDLCKQIAAQVGVGEEKSTEAPEGAGAVAEGPVEQKQACPCAAESTGSATDPALLARVHAAEARAAKVEATLAARFAAFDRERKHEVLVTRYAAELLPFGVGADKVGDLRRIVAEQGETGLKTYADAVKTYGAREPPPDWDGEFGPRSGGTAPDEAPEVARYGDRGPNALAKARKLARLYAEQPAALKRGNTLEAYLEANMETGEDGVLLGRLGR